MIGKIIQQKREGAGMTIVELSNKSGVSVAKLSDQEHEVRNMSIEDFMRVDAALDHDVVWELADYYDEVINDTQP